MPVMEFQSADADVICTKLTVLKNDALMPPFHLYRGVQLVQFTNIRCGLIRDRGTW